MPVAALLKLLLLIVGFAKYIPDAVKLFRNFKPLIDLLLELKKQSRRDAQPTTLKQKVNKAVANLKDAHLLVAAVASDRPTELALATGLTKEVVRGNVLHTETKIDAIMNSAAFANILHSVNETDAWLKARYPQDWKDHKNL
jgi:hypothetical protein